MDRFSFRNKKSRKKIKVIPTLQEVKAKESKQPKPPTELDNLFNLDHSKSSIEDKIKLMYLIEVDRNNNNFRYVCSCGHREHHRGIIFFSLQEYDISLNFLDNGMIRTNNHVQQKTFRISKASLYIVLTSPSFKGSKQQLEYILKEGSMDNLYHILDLGRTLKNNGISKVEVAPLNGYN